MEFIEECEYIWNNLVPSEGKAESLQGELLRLIEKLAYEIQFKGSVSWGVAFEDDCNFIKDSLVKSEYLSDKDKEDALNAIGEIRIVAREQYNINTNQTSEIMSYDIKYNILFDVIRNLIGKMHKKANKLISYQKDN